MRNIESMREFVVTAYLNEIRVQLYRQLCYAYVRANLTLPICYVVSMIIIVSIANTSAFADEHILYESIEGRAIANRNILHPVILVPGDGGSQVLAKLNKTTTVSYLCYQKTDYWFYMWLDPTQILPYIINCWVDNMKLLYDNVTRTTRNNEGVHLKIPDFGNTTSVEYLDVGKSSYALYFGNIVDALIDMGYERKKSIFGAPYDFRKAPNEQEEWFGWFKKLIMLAYSSNGMKPVVLVSHSMGSPMILYFLTHYVDQIWKDKYIRCQVSLSGVFGGTVRATKVFAIGDNLGSRLVSALNFRTEQRSSPSLAWLMPSPALWAKDEVLVQSQNVNITLSNYQRFYHLLNNPDGYEMWLDTKDLLKGIPAPQIEVYCWHGINVPTTEKLIYYKFPTSTPIIEKGNGDGTVNLRSMEVCLNWRDQQTKPVHYRVFKGIDHGNMIKADVPVSAVANLIRQINSKKSSNSNHDTTTESGSQSTNIFDEATLHIKNNYQRLCFAAKNKDGCTDNENILTFPHSEIKK